MRDALESRGRRLAGVLTVTLALFATGCGGQEEADPPIAKDQALDEDRPDTATQPSDENPADTPPRASDEDPDDLAREDGAVALCNNGDYSDNTDFQATCSGGDGVDHWLGTFGECNDGLSVAMSKDTDCGEHEGFNQVHPPDFVPTPRDQDVARCENGTFSDNSDFENTCSSNDGVAEWLADYGECEDGTVIEINEDTDCDGHGDFVRLLPDYEPPPTTAPPPTTERVPTTAPLPTTERVPTTTTPAPLEDRISTEFGEIKNVSLRQGELRIVVEFDESATDGLTRRAARLALTDVAESVHNLDPRPRYREVTIVVITTALIDTAIPQPVIEASFNRTALDNIPFDELAVEERILLFASDAMVLPEFLLDGES